MWVVGGVGIAIDNVTSAAYYRQSSIFKIEDDIEVGGSISPSIYGKVLKFDALADMEPLHIEKSSDLPNERPIFILKLHFNSNLEPPYSFWRWNRTSPNLYTSRCTAQQDPKDIGRTYILSVNASQVTMKNCKMLKFLMATREGSLTSGDKFYEQ